MSNNINDNEVNETNEINENVDNSYESSSDGVNENITENASNNEYKKQQTEAVPVVLENNDFKEINNYTEINDEKVKNNKGGMRKRIVSYILVGAICSTLGGIGSGIVTMNLMKRTNNNTTTTAPKATTTKSNGDSKASLITTNSTENLSVPEIVKKVSSSVVAISTKTSSSATGMGGNSAQQEGVGTGMIFSKDGYILTNYHVIQGAKTIKVMLSDGKEVSAKVVNFDAAADVAVIKLPDNTVVPGIAEFGDSDMLEVGESVVAIGNPLGKELIGSVTTGIVSAVNRQVSIEDKNLKFIQTDAAINPGNSGGPLVNSKGQVIGINTAKIGQEGVEGLGFAIPINTVNPKMDALIKQVLTIGISCRDITEEMSKQYKIPVGIYVSQIQEFSAAEKAGIRASDIITKLDGKAVKTVEELNEIKGTHKAGDIVKVELTRNEKIITLDLTLSE
jgi:serine protease Do